MKTVITFSPIFMCYVCVLSLLFLLCFILKRILDFFMQLIIFVPFVWITFWRIIPKIKKYWKLFLFLVNSNFSANQKKSAVLFSILLLALGLFGYWIPLRRYPWYYFLTIYKSTASRDSFENKLCDLLQIVSWLET